MLEVYASRSQQRAGRIAIGAQCYNPATQSFYKLLECVMPASDSEGADFEFERTLDKCLAAGYTYCPTPNNYEEGKL